MVQIRLVRSGGRTWWDKYAKAGFYLDIPADKLSWCDLEKEIQHANRVMCWSPASNISPVTLAGCPCQACITRPHLQAWTSLGGTSWRQYEKQADFTVQSVKSNAALCKELLTTSLFLQLDRHLLIFLFFYSERSERTSIASLSLSTCCMHSIRPVTTCSQQMEIRLADKPLTRAFRGHVSFKLPFYFHRYLNLPTSTVETISE